MKRLVMRSTAVSLVILMLFGMIPVSAFNLDEVYKTFYDDTAVTSLLQENNKKYVQAATGSITEFPVANGELEMGQLYAFEILREGNTHEEQTVLLSSRDYTAQYNEDYVLYTEYPAFLTQTVKGTAQPLMLQPDSAVQLVLDNEAQETSEDEIIDKLQDKSNEELQTIYDDMTNAIPNSSDTTITFKPDEDKKTVYIQTKKSSQPKGDMTLALLLSNTENGLVLGENSTMALTIKENREVPSPTLSISAVNDVVKTGSETAQVSVKRTDNIYDFTKFRLVTRGGTAVPNEDYSATQEQLEFLPGLSEIKVAIPISADPQDNVDFEVLLEVDNENINVGNSTAKITLSSDGVAASDDVQPLYGANVTASSDRGYITLPITDSSKFYQSYVSDNGICKGGYAIIDGSDVDLYFNNGGASRNNYVTYRSRDKYSMIGVSGIESTFYINGGSTVSDSFCAYASDTDYGKKNDKDTFNNNLDEYNLKGTWQTKTNVFTTPNDNGSYPINFSLHKGAIVSSAGVEIKSAKLKLKEYNLKLEKYAPITYIGTDGKQQQFNSNIDVKLNIKNGDTISTGDTKTVYRDDNLVLQYSFPDGEVQNYVQLTGYNVLNSSGNVISFNKLNNTSNTITISTDLLKSIGNSTAFKIQPCFEAKSSKLDVIADPNQSYPRFYVNNGTNSKGLYSGDFKMANGDVVATVTWTLQGNCHYLDESLFNMTIADNYKGQWKFNGYNVVTYNDANNTNSKNKDVIEQTSETFKFTALDNYITVMPMICQVDNKTSLYVKNAQYGNFSGKPNGLSANDCTVTNGLDTYQKGDIVNFIATPNDGYRAVWTYKDVTTGETQTYYGDDFYYEMQNAKVDGDNRVTLEFQSIDEAKRKSVSFKNVNLSGLIQIQKGTIKNQPSADSNQYEALADSFVTMSKCGTNGDSSGKYVFLQSENETDENGNIVVTSAPDPNNKVNFNIGSDEVRRVKILVNGVNRIVDLDFSKLINAKTSDNEMVNGNFTIPYYMSGPRANDIVAYNENDAGGEDKISSETIPLNSGKNTRFALSVNTDGKEINCARFIIRDTAGADVYTYEAESKNISETNFVWNASMAEFARSGYTLAVELCYKYYENGNTDPTYRSYGVTQSGYSFVSMDDGENVTYVPDLSVNEAHTTAMPVFGKVTPGFTILGMKPSYHQTKNDDGSKTVSIGLSWTYKYGKNNDEKYELSWGSPEEKIKKVKDSFNKLQEKINNGSKNKAFDVTSPFDMKKLKFSVGLVMGAEMTYFDDPNDYGKTKFTTTYQCIGCSGSVTYSYPFNVYGVPLFVKGNVGLGGAVWLQYASTKMDADGNRIPLTLSELGDPELNKISAGQASFALDIGFGAGVGFDSLLDGGVNLNSKFNFFFSPEQYKGTYTLTGSLFFDIVLLHLDLKYNIVNAVPMYDYDRTQNAEDVANDIMLKALADENENVLNTKIGDMDNSLEDNVTYNSIMGGSQLQSADNETILANGTNKESDISMSEIGDGKYLLVATRFKDSNISSLNNLQVQYAIYNKNTGTLEQPFTSLASDIIESKNNDRALFTNTTDTQMKSEIENLNFSTEITDVGDDLLISWNSARKIYTDGSQKSDIIKDFSISTVFYNKATGEFYNYQKLPLENSNINPKIAYDSVNNSIVMTYGSYDYSAITDDSTLSDLLAVPGTLYTTQISKGTDGYKTAKWDTSTAIASTNGKLKSYDVGFYNGVGYIAYIAGTQSDIGIDNSNTLQGVRLDRDGSKYNISNSFLLSNEEQHCASPQFAEVSVPDEDVDDLLLFWNNNNAIAYTSIADITANDIYKDADGNYSLTNEAQTPHIIMEQTDEHAPNDDLSIYTGDNGGVYALWTETESDNQQIYGSAFVVDKYETMTETAVLDSDGEVVCDSNGNPVMKTLDEPDTYVCGHWGGASQITQGGVLGSDTNGLFKRGFDANIDEQGDLNLVYNSYSYDSINNQKSNNNLVFGTYSGSAQPYIPQSGDSTIELSDNTPCPKDTVDVDFIIKNDGILRSDNVNCTVYPVVNGVEKLTPVGTLKQPISINSGETYEASIQCTMPEDVSNLQLKVVLSADDAQDMVYYKDVTYSQAFTTTKLTAQPLKQFKDDTAAVPYSVTATVTNTGNNKSDEAVFSFVNRDENIYGDLIDAEARGEDTTKLSHELYTEFGKQSIPSLSPGESCTVSFITSDIDEKYYNQYGNGYFEALVKSVDDSTFYDECFTGLTEKPVPQYINTITSDSQDGVTVSVDNSVMPSITAAPLEGMTNEELIYTVADNKVATVDECGIIKGVSQGNTVMTVTSSYSNISLDIPVTVTDKEAPTVAPTNGSSQQGNSSAATSQSDDSSGNSNSDNKNGSASSNNGKNINTGEAFALFAVVALLALSAVVILKNIKKKKSQD
ncbi:MAG TPA: hypothetical protein GX401_04245 [Clostridiales bacterium]|nr:hypothetical protein [Clostridiales bacterium]